MPKQSQQEVESQTRLIRRLIDKEDLTKDQIIEQLQISERTFYYYNKRIRKQDVKQWDKENKDSINYRKVKFFQSLENCYKINKRIAESERYSPHDRIEASKVMVTAQAQLAKLAKDGPTFNPQLPNKVITVESKEITV